MMNGFIIEDIEYYLFRKQNDQIYLNCVEGRGNKLSEG